MFSSSFSFVFYFVVPFPLVSLCRFVLIPSFLSCFSPFPYLTFLHLFFLLPWLFFSILLFCHFLVYFLLFLIPFSPVFSFPLLLPSCLYRLSFPIPLFSVFSPSPGFPLFSFSRLFLSPFNDLFPLLTLDFPRYAALLVIACARNGTTTACPQSKQLRPLPPFTLELHVNLYIDYTQNAC